MMNHKRRIQYAFNKAAHYYDLESHLQRITGKKLIAALHSEQCVSSSIIDLGCGTGMTTEQLASLYACADFHAIDTAHELLQQAKVRLSPYKVSIYHYDFDQLCQMNRRFDIIFSNMSLHWSDDFLSLLKTLTGLLSENGTFVFSIPLDETFCELEEFCAIQPFYKKEVVDSQLTQHGLELKSSSEKIIFSFSTLQDALRSIKKVGANYAESVGWNALLRKKLKETFETTLTYHVGYFIIKKIKKEKTE